MCSVNSMCCLNHLTEGSLYKDTQIVGKQVASYQHEEIQNNSKFTSTYVSFYLSELTANDRDKRGKTRHVETVVQFTTK